VGSGVIGEEKMTVYGKKTKILKGYLSYTKLKYLNKKFTIFYEGPFVMIQLKRKVLQLLITGVG